MPLVFGYIFMTKGANNIVNCSRWMLYHKWYLRINLEHYLHDSHTYLLLIVMVYFLKVRTQTINIAAGVGFHIKVEIIVRGSQRYGILVLITQQRDTYRMDILAVGSTHILIRIGRIHSVQRCHQTGTLIDRIFLGNDIFNNGAQLVVTTSVQPLGDTSVIQITDSQTLVGQQHGHQFLYVLGHQVTLWIDNETLVLQEW